MKDGNQAPKGFDSRAWAGDVASAAEAAAEDRPIPLGVLFGVVLLAEAGLLAQALSEGRLPLALLHGVVLLAAGAACVLMRPRPRDWGGLGTGAVSGLGRRIMYGA